jgi:hypothetical protein
VPLEQLVLRAQQELLVQKVLLVILDLQVPLDLLAQLVQQVYHQPVQLDLQVLLVLLVILVQQVLLVQLVHPGLLEIQVIQVIEVLVEI